MTHSVKKRPGSVLDLEVSLTQEEFHSYWQKAYDEALNKVQLKGFRPGTAPREMADKAIDKEKVFQNAANDAVRFSLDELVRENSWNIINQPKIEVTESSPVVPEEHKNKFIKKAGLKYKAELTLFPDISLPDYKKIAAKILKEKRGIAVDESEIQKTIEWLKASRAKLTRSPSPAKKGDLIEIKVESFINKSPIEDGKLEDKFVLGESRFIPGFDEKLENHKESEEIEFTLTAPSDYWKKDLQNKEIEFKVWIKEIYLRELPELNDEFAKSLGKEFDGLESLKKNIESGIALEKQQKETDRINAKIIDEITNHSKIDPPQFMINKSLESMVQETKQIMENSGAKQLTDEELKQQLYEKAKKRVLSSLVIHKIAEIENLEPSQEEIKQEAQSRNLDIQTYYDYCYTIIRNKKLFEFLEK